MEEGVVPALSGQPFRFLKVYDYFVDPGAVHICNFKFKALPMEFFATARDVLEQIEDQPAAKVSPE